MDPIDLQWGERDHVDVGGVSIHVEVAGPADAPTIACLHGFSSGTFTWAGVAPLLAGGLRVVAWDRPPFGRSERPRPVVGSADPYALPAALQRSAALVERLASPGRSVVLVGHSAGALLGVQLVLAGAARVDGLVLVAPAVDGGPPPAVRAASRLPGSAPLAASLLRVGAFGAATLLRRSTRHASPLTDATAAETGRTLRLPGTAEALWHLTTTWEPPAVLDRLGEVGVPAIVVGGIDDRIVSVAQHRAVAERLGGHLHLLEGAGHAPHEQQPTVVADLIRDFAATL